MAQKLNDDLPIYAVGLEKGNSLDNDPSRTRPISHRHRLITDKMPSARNMLLTLLVGGLLLTFGLASAVSPNNQPCHDAGTNGCSEVKVEQTESSFSRLLSSTSPETLHRFLHSYFPGTYRHGVFDSDQAALEAVHSSDPELASSIVQLARRQGNETTTDVTGTVESTSLTPTSESTEIPTTETTPTSEPSTSPTSPTSPTTTTAETTTTDATTPTEAPTTTTEVTTTTQPTTRATTGPTTQGNPTETETETSTTTETPEQTAGITTTTGTTLETTHAPPTPSTKTSTFVSTLPGGAQTTVTNVQVITAGGSEEATETSSPTGALQSDSAAPIVRVGGMEAFVGVVIGGAFLM